MCKACGLCAGICPQNALTMEKNEHQEYYPTLDFNKCTACGLCLSICIGRRIIPLKKQYPLGEFKKIYLGHSKNREIRLKGSSGGVVTTLIAWGLKIGIFSQALILGYKNNSIQPVPILTKDPDEVLFNYGSKYISYPLCNQYKEIDEKTAVTALPCHTAALKGISKDKSFIFGLFCSKRITSNAIQYVCKQEKSDFSKISGIDFRSGKWPGRLSCQTPEKKISINMNRSYWTAAYNSYFFTPPGCLFCNDYFCDKADISFGDPWIKSYMQGSSGDTIIIVRSNRGEELITSAIDNGVICAEKIDPEKVIDGHIQGIYNKRAAIRIRLKLFKLFNLPVPTFYEREMIRTSLLGLPFEIFHMLNCYFIKKMGLYNLVFKIPKWLMFIYRFSHAAMLKYYIKSIKFKERVKTIFHCDS